MTSGSNLQFYGWRIVFVVFWVGFASVGFFFYSFGIFLKPIAEDLELTRFQVSLGLSVPNVIGALVAPFLGRAIDRRSVRRIMLIGVAGVSASFLLFSFTRTGWQFYTVGALLGISGMCMYGLSWSKLIANWFDAKRGIALGISNIGTSVAGFVMPGIAAALLGWVGWRGGYALYAACTLLAIAPLVALIVVDRPEELGLEPDGDDHGRANDASTQERSWLAREILCDRNFWAIALPFGLSLCARSAIISHLVAHATDLGVALERAAWLLSLSAGIGLVSKFVLGWLADRVDPRISVWIAIASQMIGVSLLIAFESYPMLLVASACVGFGSGGLSPLQATVVGAAYGRDSFASVIGLIRPAQIGLHATGAPLAGWIFDATGSYRLAFGIFLGGYVVSALGIGALRLGNTHLLTEQDPLRATSPR